MQNEKPLNAFQKMQLGFINERLFINKNVNQYFQNHFIESWFNTITTLESGLIFFIDFTGNESYKKYIDNNLNLIEQLIESKNRKFIFNKNLKIDDHHLWFVKYYYPFLEKNINPNAHSEINNLKLLEFTGIWNNSSTSKVKKENITTGFLSIHSKGVSFIGKNDDETIEEFISKYIKFLIIDLGAGSVSNILYSISEDDSSEPFIKIDTEAQTIIDYIDKKLEELKATGKLFAVAPKIQELLKAHFNNITDENKQISTLVVNKDYKIVLPEYNNIEVKLNHLTKAIYILFLKHPNGIYLKDLKKHKQELFSIYKNTSYKDSLDQMEKSIDDLLNSPNSIFVHLSRIKSTFTLLFTDFYANNYYVKGDRGKEKCIMLSKDKIIFEAKI